MNKTAILSSILLAASAAFAQPQVGDLVPDFSLQSAHGGSVALSDYEGKAVMLFFLGFN